MTTTLEDLSPVHQRMLKVLGDGLPHKREELEACLMDDLGGPKATVIQLSKLRKVLQSKGLDVVCRALGGRNYHRWQLFRLYLPGE